MGCTQSNQYYLGFLNISISHIDVLSFFLGIAVAIGTIYLVGCIRHQRKANNHILGRGKARTFQGWGSGHAPEWNNYPMAMAPRASLSLSTLPDQPPIPTAPYPKQPVAIPWPAQQWSLPISLSQLTEHLLHLHQLSFQHNNEVSPISLSQLAEHSLYFISSPESTSFTSLNSQTRIILRTSMYINHQA